MVLFLSLFCSAHLFVDSCGPMVNTLCLLPHLVRLEHLLGVLLSVFCIEISNKRMRINVAVSMRTVRENFEVSNPGYVVYTIYGTRQQRKQHNSTTPKTTPKKKLPQVGLEPTTLYSLDKCSII